MDNTTLFFQIYELSHQNFWLDSLMVFGADYLIYLIALFLFFTFLFGRQSERKSVLLAVISVVVSSVMIKIMRIFFFEPRPFVTYNITPLINHAADASFPSVHIAAMAAITATFIIQKNKLAWVMVAALIWGGFARIFIGIHYPWDILGGMAIGISSTFLIWLFWQLIQHTIHKIT